MANRGFSAVVFDIGGVLLEWKPDEIVRTFTNDPEMQALIKREIFDHPDWLAMDKGELSEVEAIGRASRRSGIQQAQLGKLMGHINDSLVPIQGSVSLVKQLADDGVGLYCLSNMPDWRFEELHSRYSFWNYFQEFVISGAIKMMKPDREIFEYFMTRFSRQPSTTIFIDDHQPNIDAARQIGIGAILFNGAADCHDQLRTRFDWGR
ncbi:MAG TPA: HAD family phosphatase [Pyrinomonadaceae bacterium]|nr:HAD family phosphatase [Pyrinomonadaceae bacterium]